MHAHPVTYREVDDLMTMACKTMSTSSTASLTDLLGVFVFSCLHARCKVTYRGCVPFSVYPMVVRVSPHEQHPHFRRAHSHQLFFLRLVFVCMYRSACLSVLCMFVICPSLSFSLCLCQCRSLLPLFPYATLCPTVSPSLSHKKMEAVQFFSYWR